MRRSPKLGVMGAGEREAGVRVLPIVNSSAAGGRPRLTLTLPFGRLGPRGGGAGGLKNCVIERLPTSSACCGVNIALGGISTRTAAAESRARKSKSVSQAQATSARTLRSFVDLFPLRGCASAFAALSVQSLSLRRFF